MDNEQEYKPSWRTAVAKRLKKDFRHVTYTMIGEDKYSPTILEVGWDSKNHIKITMEEREHYGERDVEMLRDACLVLYYRNRTHEGENHI